MLWEGFLTLFRTTGRSTTAIHEYKKQDDQGLVYANKKIISTTAMHPRALGSAPPQAKQAQKLVNAA